MGSDKGAAYSQHAVLVFQSTLPVWGATMLPALAWLPIKGFNPRSPCGERPEGGTRKLFTYSFNPRSPCGERPAGVFAEKATS